MVVAADGLDRVLGYDSNDLNWSQRLDALAAVTARRAPCWCSGLENEFSLTNLLDRRPADERHGDDEWRPLHDDPTRPVSTDAAAWLSWPGSASGAATYASYSVEETPFALVTTDIAAAARPGQLPARLAVEALEASARRLRCWPRSLKPRSPLLAPVCSVLPPRVDRGRRQLTPVMASTPRPHTRQY